MENNKVYFKNIEQIDLFDKTIIGIYYFLLLIDSFNGFFLDNGINIPLSQLTKSILLLFMSSRLCRSYTGRLILWSTFFYVACLYVSYSFVIGVDLTLTYTHLFKLIITIWAFFYFKDIAINVPSFLSNNVFPIIKSNAIILIINVLLGLIGLGSKSYGDIGSKGYFYAANELSGLIMVMCPFCLFYIREKTTYNTLIYYLVLLFFLASSALLGTKTALIVVLLSAFIVPSLSSSNKHKHSYKMKLFLSSILILCVIITLGYYLLDDFGLLERWSFFYERGGLTSLLLSGRDEYWLNEKGEILNSNIMSLMWGLGGSRTVEMDPFDTFLNYGIIGMILVYSFYTFLLYTSYVKSKYSHIAKIVFYINLLIIFASSLSGHIIFSGMTGPFIALINSLIYIPNYLTKNR